MSCLDSATCQSHETFTRINCNFVFGYIEYLCNPALTCQRVDNLYDCCASTISECIIERFNSELLPTMSPTIIPNVVSLCENTCNNTPSINTCYWFERQNVEISCVGKDNHYCCSHSRDECCQTNIIVAYIIFSSILLLIAGYTTYKYVILMYTRVVPEKNTKSVPMQQKDALDVNDGYKI